MGGLLIVPPSVASSASGTGYGDVEPDAVAFGDSDYWSYDRSSPISNTTSNTPGKDTIRVRAQALGRTRTMTAYGIVCTTGQSGAVARLSLWELDATGYPSALAHQGEVDLSSTGLKTVTGSVTIDLSKRYAFGFCGDAPATAPTVRVYSTSALPHALYLTAAGTTIASSATQGWGWSVAFTYDVMPSTFPSGASALGVSRDAFPVFVWQGTGT